jgi:hypothetical protein
MLLISERESSGRIHPPIGSNVLGIVKLLVIEDRWPDWYQKLKDDPRQIEQWRTPEGIESSEMPPEMKAFLRLTARVAIPNAAAYIRLKQREIETRLPDYFEFVDSLRGRADETASGILARASDAAQRVQYLSEVDRLLAEDVSNGYLVDASAVVGSVFAVPAIREHTETVSSVIKRCLSSETLLGALASADADHVLDAAASLDESERTAVVSAVVHEAVADAEAGSVEAAAARIAALVRHSALLTDDAWEALKAGTAQAPTLTEAYAPLATARPSAISLEASQRAAETLTSAGAPIDNDLASIHVHAAYLTVSGDASQAQALVQLLGQTFASLVGAAEWARLAEFSKAVRPILETVPISDGGIQQVWEPFQAAWGSIPDAELPSALAVIDAVIGRYSDSSVADAPLTWFVDQLEARPATFLDLLAADALPASFRQPAHDRAWRLAGGHHGTEIATTARALISGWPDEDIEDGLVTGTTAAQSAGHTVEAVALVSELSDRASEEIRARAIDSVLACPGVSSPQSSPDQLVDVADLPWRLLSPSQAETLRAALLEALKNPAETVGRAGGEAFRRALKDPAFADVATSIVQQAWDWLTANMPVQPSMHAQLCLVAEHHARLSDSQQDQLARAIPELIRTQPSDRLFLSSLAGTLRETKPAVKAQLCQELLSIESAEPEVDTRVQLLSSVRDLGPSDGSKAGRRLKDRLRQLGASDSADDRRVSEALGSS